MIRACLLALLLVAAFHAPALADPEKVPVRGGVHQGFNRLVFDFTGTASVKAESTDQGVVLNFSKAASADAAQIMRQKLPLVSNAKILSSNPLRVQLGSKGAVSPKISKLGNKIVVDLYPGAVKKQEEKAKPAAEKKPEPKEEPKKETPLELTPWSETSDLKTEAAKTPEPEKPAEPVKETKPPAVPAPVEPADASKPVPPQEQKAPAEEKAEAPPLPASVAAEEEETAVYPAVQLTVPSPVKVALFQRGRSLWLVFDQKLTAIPARVDSEEDDMAAMEVERYEIQGGTAYRFLTRGPVSPRLKIKSKTLQLEFSKSADSAISAPVFKTAMQNNAKSKLMEYVISASGAALMPIKDPEVGDTILALPVADTDETEMTARDYVQFRLLRTWRGLAVVPKIDDLEVRPGQEDIRMTTPLGIIAGSASSVVGGSAKKLFVLDKWKDTDGHSLRERQMELEMSMLKADEARRGQIMMQLARFHFANGHAQEALGWLKLIAKKNPAMTKDISYTALRAATLIWAHDVDDAEQELAQNPDLQNQAEIALWRGYGAAQQARWPDARTYFQQASGLLFNYPAPFQIPILLSAADMALALQDASTADYVMGNLEKSEEAMSAAQKMHYDYLRAMLALQKGEGDEAYQQLEEVVAANDAQFTTKAAFQLLELDLKSSKIEPLKAAEKMESLRFAWRGDEFERIVLNRLADLYIEAQKPRQAFDSLRTVIRNFPNTEDSKTATARLQEKLAFQFDDAQLDKMSPIEAAALYQDYQDYIEKPEDKIAIKLKVADHMVKVGFTDQAIAMFSDMAAKDLQGADKTKTLLKLAGLQLVDNQPDQAIKALDDWVKEPLVQEQAREAVLLRARALMMQKNYDAARDQLKSMNDDDARRLKIDIDWRAANWAGAAETLGELIGTEPVQALNEEQEKLVLNRAVALALSNNIAELQALRASYKEAMDKTASAGAFDLVTRPAGAEGLASVQAIQARIGEVDLFKNFLQGYGAKPAASAK